MVCGRLFPLERSMTSCGQRKVNDGYFVNACPCLCQCLASFTDPESAMFQTLVVFVFAQKVHLCHGSITKAKLGINWAHRPPSYATSFGLALPQYLALLPLWQPCCSDRVCSFMACSMCGWLLDAALELQVSSPRGPVLHFTHSTEVKALIYLALCTVQT